MIAFIIRSRQVKRKVCQYCGTYVGLTIAAAANIITAQATIRRVWNRGETIINTCGPSKLTEQITPTCDPLWGQLYNFLGAYTAARGPHPSGASTAEA